jgi:hypothetical protein
MRRIVPHSAGWVKVRSLRLLAYARGGVLVRHLPADFASQLPRERRSNHSLAKPISTHAHASPLSANFAAWVEFSAKKICSATACCYFFAASGGGGFSFHSSSKKPAFTTLPGELASGFCVISMIAQSGSLGFCNEFVRS